MDAFEKAAKGRANRGKELRVFDWNKAAQLIKERQPKRASAGLKHDWEFTGGEIYCDGKIREAGYTYLASNWATPELDMDGELVSCYKMQSQTPNWDANTTWPQSAKDILLLGAEVSDKKE